MNKVETIGIILSAVGIIITIGLYFYTTKYKRPVYTHVFEKLAQKRSVHKSEIQILYNGQEVSGLSTSTIRIWNAGRKTIRGKDLLKDRPFCIKLLDSEIITSQYVSTDTMRHTLNTRLENNNQSLIIEFDAMQHNEGFLIEVLHTSNKKASIFVTGDIDEALSVKEIRTAAVKRIMCIIYLLISLSYIPYVYSFEGLSEGGVFGRGLFHGSGDFFNKYASEMGLIGMIFLQVLIILIPLFIYSKAKSLYPKKISELKIEN